MPKLSASEVRRIADPRQFTFSTTAEVDSLHEIVGQERAVRALKFGLGIDEEGYNIFVSGAQGTGKNTAIRRFIESYAKSLPTPPDWCYVHNFRDPYRPVALSLPPGQANVFRSDIELFVESARRQIQEAFESDEYAERLAAIRSHFEESRHRTLSSLEQLAAAAGYSVRATQMGVFLVPVRGGQALTDQEIAAMAPEERERLRQAGRGLEDRLREALKEIRKVERETIDEAARFHREVARFAIGGLLDDLKEKYSGQPAVVQYLNDVEQDIVENVDAFRGDQRNEPPSNARPFQPNGLMKYAVNVVVDNGRSEGAPVVFESNPTYYHLFGRIEKEASMGTLHTNFTLIKSGTIHTAAGGFLVMQVEDLLRNAFSWEALKRALREGEIELEEPFEKVGMPTTKSLRPLPIPLKLKVILIGTPAHYSLLYAYDSEFPELFKVKADFDTIMDRDEDGVRSYVEFIGTLCRVEGHCNFDRTAVAKVIEHGSRLAEHQDKLSTKFSSIADVLREASYWAKEDGSDVVTGRHVERALNEKHFRLSLIEDRVQELIREGTIRVETKGEAIGQINGLSVLSLGDHSFGRPSKITCSVSVGQEGVVDIERQVKLGGPIHSKGMMILTGFLLERFGQEHPPALSARIVFEQSYSGVDGDSASCAELVALLSRLSECPIRQGIAMTGSINQKGEVQAIGGVNEKVEGYFDVCKALGIDGNQGVVIPSANVKHLMLREDVVEAIDRGDFHIYAVDSVDEAIEITMGKAAGVADAHGRYPADSVYGRAQAALRAMAKRMRRYARPESTE